MTNKKIEELLKRLNEAKDELDSLEDRNIFESDRETSNAIDELEEWARYIESGKHSIVSLRTIEVSVDSFQSDANGTYTGVIYNNKGYNNMGTGDYIVTNMNYKGPKENYSKKPYPIEGSLFFNGNGKKTIDTTIHRDNINDFRDGIQALFVKASGIIPHLERRINLVKRVDGVNENIESTDWHDSRLWAENIANGSYHEEIFDTLNVNVRGTYTETIGGDFNAKLYRHELTGCYVITDIQSFEDERDIFGYIILNSVGSTRMGTIREYDYERYNEGLDALVEKAQVRIKEHNS